jgi:hypothetical protein
MQASRQATGRPPCTICRRLSSGPCVDGPCRRCYLRSVPALGVVRRLCSPPPGFSFSGEVREPFPAVIQAMQDAKVLVTSVDAPSSWNIEEGPPMSGVGSAFHPDVLVSLTAPKPLVKYFKGRHFIGGRYVPCLDHLFQTCCWAIPPSLSSPFPLPLSRPL